MEIAEYTPADIGLEWIERIEKCGWKAAGILADLLRDESRFDEILRGGALYILKDGEELVSFATLTGRECIDADDLYPWIGFVFTAPEYRGHRYGGRLIEHICSQARKNGWTCVYVATENAGEVYEKYGFEYVEDRQDVFGEMNRIYCRKL